MLKSPELTHCYLKLVLQRLHKQPGWQSRRDTSVLKRGHSLFSWHSHLQQQIPILRPTWAYEKLIHQIPPSTESCTDVVCNCNQQAASMPSLTHTNPTFKCLWRLHILLSPPSMTVFQVLILTAPLPADESFYQHTQAHKAPSTRLTGVEPGFPGPMLEPQLRVILPHCPTLRNTEIKQEPINNIFVVFHIKS